MRLDAALLLQGARIRRLIYGIFFLLILICNACGLPPLSPPEQTEVAVETRLLWNQPDPKPDFVTSVDVEGLNQQCVKVSQSKVWEKGDEADALGSHIKNTTQLHVDRSQIQNLEFSSVASLTIVRDENDQVLGSVGGTMRACFNVQGFSTGLHLSEIVVRSTSGKPHQYRWAFLVTKNTDSTIVSVPPTICEFTCEATLQIK
jgi:hypothetical protein